MHHELLRRPLTSARESEDQQVRRTQLRIQRRMAVGASDDPHEREADRVADVVVRRLASSASMSPTVFLGTSGSGRIRRSASGLASPDAVVGTGTTGNGRIRRSASGLASPDAVVGTSMTGNGRIRRSARAGRGDGFVAPEQVERDIQQQRGGGTPLDPATRERFEGAMGADLGGVRIHEGSTSDRLNRQVSAKAFTTGQDVFFSAGSYSPDSREGQHLLAHELAHTVQQGGSVQRTTIRRLTLANTDFATTETVEVFAGGASGNVAKFTDPQGSVIVKVNQAIGNEVSVADKLAGAVGKKRSGTNKKAGKDFGVTAPGSRVASPTEIAAIKLATQNHLIPNTNPRNFITGLDSPNPVIIADSKAGTKFREFANGDALTQLDPQSASGKGKMMNTEALGLKLLLKGPMLGALAQNAPADIVMGMFDRIVGSWNSENFLFDPTTQEFSFVDNTQNRPGGFLTSVTTQGILTTHEDSFRAWAGEHHVTKLRDKNFTAIADGMLETVANGVSANSFSIQTNSGQRMDKELRAMLATRRPKLLSHIKKGLEAGYKATMKELNAPLRLAAGVQPAKKNQTVHSLIARHRFLLGDGVDQAWLTAQGHADRVAPPIVEGPQGPVNGPPIQQPGGNPAPNNPGGWAAAQGQGAGNRIGGGGSRARAGA